MTQGAGRQLSPVAKGNKMIERCFICNEPVVAKYLNPPLCQRHHDFSVLRMVTRRTGYEITVHNLEINYKRVRFDLSFQIEEIPALLEEMTAKQKTIEFGGDVPE